MQVWVQLPSRVQKKGNNLLLPFCILGIMFFTYILYSAKYDRYYIGHCEDMNKRLYRHNSKMVTATKNFIPWEIVYYEQFESRIEANKTELYIKRMKSRKYVEKLILNWKTRPD